MQNITDKDRRRRTIGGMDCHAGVRYLAKIKKD